MNILIVDDEELLRNRVHAILSDSGLPIKECWLAENAIEAMKLVDEKQPDIVLSDIRMPIKTGLDLAAHVREVSPDIPVILITGYPDFEYARSAIQNNVFDYIMKPVDPDKLIETVARAQKKRELDKKHSQLYMVFQEYFSDNLETIRRQFFETLLFGRGSDRDADEQRAAFRLDFDTYRLVAVHCRMTMEGNRMQGEYYCTYLVEKYIRELLPQTVTYAFGNLVFFLWEVQNEDTAADNRALITLLNRTLFYARQNFMGTLRAGISQASDTFSNLQTLRCQTSDCLDLLKEDRKMDFAFFEDVLNSNQTWWETEDAVHELTAAVRSGSLQAAMAQLDRLEERLRSETPEYQLSTCFLVTSSISFLLQELDLKTDGLLPLTDRILDHVRQSDPSAGIDFLRSWIREICQLISSEFQRRTNVVVSNVLSFINQRYAEPVGLEEVSRHVGRNSSYVSRLIKEHTGKSFTQLLTEKRVQEAKRLLRETSMKITDVAEQVGYGNVRYFNRVFKSAVNMSANDYRAFSTTFN